MGVGRAENNRIGISFSKSLLGSGYKNQTTFCNSNDADDDYDDVEGDDDRVDNDVEHKDIRGAYSGEMELQVGVAHMWYQS